MKVALVLSGGAMYGFAHIGVIKVLQEENIKFDIVCGTSMGAIVGGLYCAGISTEKILDLLKDFSINKIIDFSISGIRNKGLLNGKKAIEFFEEIVHKKRIENLKKTYACVSTDLLTGKEYIFTSGYLSQAMRASMSVPALFKPVDLDGKILVDGGLISNLPVSTARNLGADFVISVDVCSFYKPQGELKSPLDILVSSANLAMSTQVVMQKDKGDIYIKIDSQNINFDKYSYENALKSISLGEMIAKEYVGRIKSEIKKYKNKKN